MLSDEGALLTANEAVVFLLVRSWLKELFAGYPDNALSLDHPENRVTAGQDGELWGRLSAGDISERLQSQLSVGMSTVQVRKALEKLTEKSLLLREKLASQYWNSTFFYRVSPDTPLPEGYL